MRYEKVLHQDFLLPDNIDSYIRNPHRGSEYLEFVVKYQFKKVGVRAVMHEDTGIWKSGIGYCSYTAGR